MVSGCTLFLLAEWRPATTRRRWQLANLLEAEYARQGLEPVPEPSVRKVS